MKLTGKPIDPTATIRRILRPRAIRGSRAAVVLAAGAAAVAIPLAASASAQAAPTSATTITAGHHAGTIPPQALRLIRESRHLPAHQAGPRILRSAKPNATGTANSQAWGGYVDSAKSVAFRYASANFNIPSLNCASSPPGSSGFALADPSVGLGGFTSSGVSGEQVGALVYCSGSTQVGPVLWYYTQSTGIVGMTDANSGDAVQLSVYYNKTTGDYSLSAADLTNPSDGFNHTYFCTTCDNSSAEVVTQAYFNTNDPVNGYNLADYGAVSPTSVAVTARNGTHGTLASNSVWGSTNVKMIDGTGQALETAGPLQGGSAFLESWHQAS
jgi:Peptidase A4 family